MRPPPGALYYAPDPARGGGGGGGAQVLQVDLNSDGTPADHRCCGGLFAAAPGPHTRTSEPQWHHGSWMCLACGCERWEGRDEAAKAAASHRCDGRFGASDAARCPRRPRRALPTGVHH